MLSSNAIRAFATLDLLLSQRVFLSFAPVGLNQKGIHLVPIKFRRAFDCVVQQAHSGAFSADQPEVGVATSRAAYTAETFPGQHYHHSAVPAAPHLDKALPQTYLAPSSLRSCAAAPWIGSRRLFLREKPWALVRSCSSISSNDAAPIEPSPTTPSAQEGYPNEVANNGVSRELEKASNTLPEPGSMQSSGIDGGTDAGAAGLGLAAVKQKKKQNKQSPAGAKADSKGLVDYTSIRGHTFHDSVPTVFQAIREADFVAFDLEYTGINTAPWLQMGEFDNKDTIFAKRRQSAESFVVLQFGLCPFRWEPSEGHFKVSPFNFLICPPVKNTHSFFCEPASLKFLLQNRIQIQESLNNGIPYLCDAEERAFKERHLGRKLQEATPFKDHEFHDLSPEDNNTIEKKVRDIADWHDATSAASKTEEGSPSRLQIHSLTLLQRRVIVEALRRLFPKLVPVTLNDADGHTWEMGAGTEAKSSCTLQILYAESEAEKAAHEARLRAEIEAQTQEFLDRSVGFKRVVEELARGPAFLVGHNCMLDLMHVLDKFGPGAPPTLSEFCTDVRSRFPVIFDTKHIVFSDGVANNWGGLTSLYQSFRRTNDYDIPVKTAEGFENVPDLPTPAQRQGHAKHDGGRDAFTAGLLFARLAKRRGVEPGELCRLPDLFQGRDSFQSLMWTPRKMAEDGSGRLAKEREAMRPLQKLALTANWLYAGMIYNVRASFSLLRHGFVRSCRAEDEALHRDRLRHHRPDVLLLWAFPEELSDKQILGAIAAQQAQKGHKIDRLDARAALVRFPNVELANAFWEAALTLQGQMGRGGLAALEGEPGREALAKVETYGTFVEVCQSGITAPNFAQAATWLGLDPLRPLLRREQAGVGIKEFERIAQRVKAKWAWRKDASGSAEGEQVDKRWKPEAKRVWRREKSEGTNVDSQPNSVVNPVMEKERESTSTRGEQIETQFKPEEDSVRGEESGTTEREQVETQLQSETTSVQS